MTSNCEPLQEGSIHQDPHFEGLDGTSFFFGGTPGRVFSLISDADLQLNAAFVRFPKLGDYLGRIGLRSQDANLVFDPSFGVFFNGSLVTSGAHELHGAASFSVEMVDNRPRFQFRDEKWTITIRAGTERGNRADVYSNIQVVNHIFTNPMGLIGRTAQPEGSATGLPLREADYVVHDGILGIETALGRFAWDVDSDGTNM